MNNWLFELKEEFRTKKMESKLKKLTNEDKNDKELALAAIKLKGSFIKHFSYELQTNKEFIVTMMKQNPYVLWSLPKEVTCDDEFLNNSFKILVDAGYNPYDALGCVGPLYSKY